MTLTKLNSEALNRVACIGGANVDRKVFLKEAAIVGTSNPVVETTTYGGVVRNIAENLAHLGIAPQLFSIVGDDAAGRALLAQAKLSMDTTAVAKTAHYGTGTYSALLQPDGSMFIGLAAMEICDLMDADWVESQRDQLSLCNWLICDCNMMTSGIAALLDLAADQHKKLAIIGVSGPKMRHLPADLGRPTVGVFNVDESQAYFNTAESDPLQLAALWLAAGFRQIVVTAGADPFVYGEQGGQLYSKAVIKTTRVCDVTGAGDAFSSGLLYGLIRGYQLAQAVEFAALNAALTIQSQDSVRADLTEALLIEESIKRGLLNEESIIVNHARG